MNRKTVVATVALVVALTVVVSILSRAAHKKVSVSQMEMKDVVAAKYFSSDYKEARKKFLDASHGVGATIESFKNPRNDPKGFQLFTDVAFIGPRDANTILVLVSGTHGVEGFCGSSIQTGLLVEGIVSPLKPGMSIVMVHALNPYGFAYLRRFNEDNVDLNRNFVDHSKPYPENAGYERLSNILAPKSLSFPANVASLLRLMWYRLSKGKVALQTAISRGQYSHPKGLFYGGEFETWSNKTIRMIAKRYLSQAARVAVVDCHTGLGPCGRGEIILNECEESLAYQRAVAWWGSERVTSTCKGESVSVPIGGSLKLAFPEMLPNAEVTAVSLEFGTSSLYDVLKAMRAENWLHHYGGKNHPDAEKIKNEMLRVFYPDTDDWKNLVWIQGKEVIVQALKGITS